MDENIHQADDNLIDENNGEDKMDEGSVEKIEMEKKMLLGNVTSGNLITSKDKVGFILNHHVDARNSDIDLAWNYWRTFEKEKFNGFSITKEQMFTLTRISSLTRTRAKIQNEYKLFQAEDSVKKYRGVLEKEKKAQEIEDKPTGLPMYGVYIDETGKNDDYLCIGSLWLVDGGVKILETTRKLDMWKRENSINYEFHFAEVKKHKLEAYKNFFRKFINLNPTVGFKLIAVRNTGFRGLSQAITDLTFHLINRGISHENITSRAPLPRVLQVWMDEEETGSDTLKIENLKERIKGLNLDGLYLDDIQSISSESNYFIQAVDLFTASINRKLNVTGMTNHKDELADFILGLTNFSLDQLDLQNSDVDSAVVFNLSEFD